MWITNGKLAFLLILRDFCTGPKKLAKAEHGTDVDALHISTVSIVDRFAVCSETAFSYESIGALPQPPQGAPPLDPARDFIP